MTRGQPASSQKRKRSVARFFDAMFVVDRVQFTHMGQLEHAEHDPITHSIIGASIEIRKSLGIGLLESAYHGFLVPELQIRGLKVLSQQEMPVSWKGITVKVGYRADLIVEDMVIVELKAVKELTVTDSAQILTYMRLSRLRTGLLINFHAVPFSKGIKRFSL